MFENLGHALDNEGKMDELKLKNEMERTGERVYRLEESFVY